MEAEARKVMGRLNPNFRRFKEPVTALSGGQRQSVAIARAIHFNARILIMDEPTAALGPAETAQVGELVKQLKAEGIGIFLISHDIHDVFDLADRVTVMKNGQIVGSGRVQGHDQGRSAGHDHPRQVPAWRDPWTRGDGELKRSASPESDAQPNATQAICFFASDGSRPAASSRFASWRAARASFNPMMG